MSVKEVLKIIEKQLINHGYNYIIKRISGFIKVFVMKNDKLVMTITIIPHKKNILESGRNE
jgi:hypothetical protein